MNNALPGTEVLASVLSHSIGLIAFRAALAIDRGHTANNMAAPLHTLINAGFRSVTRVFDRMYRNRKLDHTHTASIVGETFVL